MAIDGDGNVVIAGTIWNGGTGYDFTVVKLDGASGEELWRQAIDGSVNGEDRANAVALDGDGNVVAGGSITMPPGPGGGNNFVVFKFNGVSGMEVWRQIITLDYFLPEAANAVTVDGAGNVAAAGMSDHQAEQSDFRVAKFNGATGALMWQQKLHGSGWPVSNDRGNAVVADGAGNVIAAGVTVNMYINPNGSIRSTSDFTVIKFDGASGVVGWQKVIPSASDTGGGANAVKVDSEGNVIAAGVVSNNATVVKLRGTDGGDYTAPAPGATILEETAATVQYAGCPWYTTSHALLSGESAWLAMQAGAQVRVTFTGTGIRWIGYRDPWAGKANVYLDGQYHSTIDTYATPNQAQAEVLRISGLPAGDHWLIIEPTGTHHEQSGGSWVWLDAVDVENADGSVTRVENTAAAVQDLNCPWYTTTHPVLSGGSARTAMVPGAQAIFSFTGTGVSWVTYRSEWTGKARVYLDGVLQGEVDTYATPAQAQAVMSTLSGLASGQHVLIIEATGESNPASSGTWVWVDAFQVQP